ncbi:hypothetical protein MWN41_06525 [Ornithobacterium rhinotracheale]|uniref:hypothetical protein n=1 Tax=Ornithobacterium rhinotracheale TaxID=28251 RepID=UPI001FF5F44C|nr:hypothetical protein [Ornithobacterium rhinotracheale]MCK0202673.1 hypothetical protein [Ornithobacterium rhinotracheale]
MESIFKNNPQLDVVYKTSDGKFFYTENFANNYAQTLEDKKVTKLVRPTTEESKGVTAVETEAVAETSKKTKKAK